MVGVPSPFGGSDTAFDAYDEFVPGNVPPPGPFLDGHDVLAGRRHLAVHRLARELFEERGVYDMTFGYNLARLNVDPRHRDAGYRYAVEGPDADDAVAGGDGEADDGDDGGSPRVLRAEFTPTTAFCPQSDTLTKASFRAWNGLADRHEFDLVRVRVAPMHQRAVAINGELKRLETAFRETGEVPGDDAGVVTADRPGPDTDSGRSPDGSTPPF
jgi:hypothetical protein